MTLPGVSTTRDFAAAHTGARAAFNNKAAARRMPEVVGPTSGIAIPGKRRAAPLSHHDAVAALARQRRQIRTVANQIGKSNPAEEFASLPEAVRLKALLGHVLLSTVQPPIQQSLGLVATQMGVSLKAARRRFDLWRKPGVAWQARTYQGAIDRRRLPQATRPKSFINPEFIEWFERLAELYQGEICPAWRAFCRKWSAGRRVPGFPEGLSRRTLPPGTSYCSLLRHLRHAADLTPKDSAKKFLREVLREARTADAALRLCRTRLASTRSRVQRALDRINQTRRPATGARTRSRRCRFLYRVPNKARYPQTGAPTE